MAHTILITGSTSGFGRLMVERLARDGHTVFAGMRAVEGRNAPAAQQLRALAHDEQIELHPIEIDVDNDISVEQAVESVVGATGRLDVAVNNAGTALSGPVEAFTMEQARQQFDTNFFGVLRVNRAAVPHMRRQRGGLLLQMGSIVGRLALPFMGLYASTKFALEALTEAYRVELAPFGVEAAIVEPGTYPTSLKEKASLAADTERAALYQDAWDAFSTQLFAEEESDNPPDPQDVVDAVATIIAQPAGQRPLHTVVAPAAQRGSPQAVNDAVTQATQSFFEALALPQPAFAGAQQR